ncbi:MAG: glycosyltransferase family 39 protein [Bacteroidales bacterium]|nr:glycosyltransferase family 39 protein [Clostridium sp.]MCM1202897.1 glycosyltransferase family 39 protein [Bacteroidales bacterium]
MSKILVVALALMMLCIVIGLWVNKIRLKSISALVFVLCGLVIGFNSWKIAYAVIKLPTEQIEITAGEASGKEVFLENYVVDDRYYDPEAPVQGKWMKQGKAFGWRNEKKLVIKGLTKTVVMEIPTGRSRELVFRGGERAGEVTVRYGDEVYCKNLSADEDEEVSVSIADSGSREIYLHKIELLAGYVLLMAALLAILSLCYRKWRTDRSWCVGQWEAKKDYILYLALAVYAVIYLLFQADLESFWYDELYSVGYAMTSEAPNSSFISFGLLRWIYQVTPYGQAYLLLVPILEFGLAVYMLGLTGKRMRSGKVGLYAAAFLAFSPYLYKQAALEYRMYAIMLLCSVVALYMFIIRFQGKRDNWWKITGYGLALFMLMDSHEYGKVVAGLFVLIDLILVWAKQMKKKHLVSDIFPVAYGLFWLKMNAVGGLWNNYSWTKNPKFDDVYQTLLELCSGNEWQVWLFVLGIILLAAGLIQNYYQRKLLAMKMKYEYVPFLLIVGVFSASIVYSDYVNPMNSLYVNRYFISVVAYIFLIMAVALDGIVRWIAKEKQTVGTICGIWLLLIIALQGRAGYVNEPFLDQEDYRGTAEVLSGQKNIYNKSTLVYIAEDKYATKGWEYYFTHKGKFDAPNLAGNEEIPEDCSRYKTVYVVWLHNEVDEDFRDILEEEYQFVRKLKDGNERKSVLVFRKK